MHIYMRHFGCFSAFLAQSVIDSYSLRNPGRLVASDLYLKRPLLNPLNVT
jgi:hypothetical protein